MNYCSAVWSKRYKFQTTQLRKGEKRAARLIVNETYETHSAELFKNLKWISLHMLEERFEFNRKIIA